MLINSNCVNNDRGLEAPEYVTAMPDELLTLAEVARVLRVSSDTVARHFAKIKGVIDIGSPETPKRRRYRVLRIPEECSGKIPYQPGRELPHRNRAKKVAVSMMQAHEPPAHCSRFTTPLPAFDVARDELLRDAVEDESHVQIIRVLRPERSPTGARLGWPSQCGRSSLLGLVIACLPVYVRPAMTSAFQRTFAHSTNSTAGDPHIPPEIQPG